MVHLNSLFQQAMDSALRRKKRTTLNVDYQNTCKDILFGSGCYTVSNCYGPKSVLDEAEKLTQLPFFNNTPNFLSNPALIAYLKKKCFLTMNEEFTEFFFRYANDNYLKIYQRYFKYACQHYYNVRPIFSEAETIIQAIGSDKSYFFIDQWKIKKLLINETPYDIEPVSFRIKQCIQYNPRTSLIISNKRESSVEVHLDTGTQTQAGQLAWNMHTIFQQSLQLMQRYDLNHLPKTLAMKKRPSEHELDPGSAQRTISEMLLALSMKQGVGSAMVDSVMSEAMGGMIIDSVYH